MKLTNSFIRAFILTGNKEQQTSEGLKSQQETFQKPTPEETAVGFYSERAQKAQGQR